MLINKNQLITIAANSKLLINLTAKLCGYRYIKDDLFQEFLLILLETEEQKLIDKMNEGKFISHCSNLINRLNIDRYRAKKFINTSNPLVERNDTFELDFDIKDECYNFDIDVKFEKVVKLVREQPLKGQILFQSVVSTTREIASELGIKEKNLIYANNKFKIELRKQIR